MKIYNMALEEIIQALNTYIEDKRNSLDIVHKNKQHLVLHRVLETHSTFKSYKKYEITLWVVSNENRYKLFTISEQFNINASSQEEFYKYIETKFIITLLQTLLNKASNNRTVIEDIIYGEYIN